MPAFRRVFRADPGDAVLAEIEAIVIVDIAPPPGLQGAGVGAVLLVGEFERGSFTTAEVFGGQDLVTTYGGLGRITETSIHDGAVAVKSGGDEPWNGNGFIWLRNKSFSRLFIQRVDNSAGVVSVTRLACLVSGAAGPLAANDTETISFRGADGTIRTATVSAAAAQKLATGAAYPVNVDGLTLEITIDDEPLPKLVVFTAAETALADIVAKINAVTALSIASDVGGQLAIDSVIVGRSGFVKVEGTANTVLGFPVAPVQEVQDFEFASASVGTYTMQIEVIGRETRVYTSSITYAALPTVTQIRNDIFDGFAVQNIEGITLTKDDTGTPNMIVTFDDNVHTISGTGVVVEPTPGDVVVTNPTPEVLTAAYGTGNVPNAAQISLSQAAVLIDAVTGLSAGLNADGQLRVCADTSIGVGATHTLRGEVSTLLVPWGFNVVDVADASDAADVTIPAGTRYEGTNSVWSQLQDFDTGIGRGPWDIKVRPFVDDDTALSDTAATVTTILDALPDGFVVTNAATLTRLSATQLETKYREAFDKTIDINTAAREANMIASARASAGILTILRQNALDATGAGLRARKAIGRPLLGTDRDTLKSNTGVGVGANRDQRLIYCGVGFTTQIPEIQEVGSRQGTGFTDDGVIEVGSDGFYASTRSILPPEENAGQYLGDTNVGSLNVLSLEDAYNPLVGGVSLTMEDYISFKRNGIVVPRFSREFGWAFQSDVTSVDGTLDANVADASRRFMADFIIDSLGDLSARYVKKLGSPSRRRALLLTADAFLSDLESPDNPESSRIDSYSILETSTQRQREAGFMLISVKVKTHPHLLAIQFTVQVGPTVVIEEEAA